jgi:hypothetical protein
LQLDELYAVLRELKAGEISEDEAIKRLERSPYWVWTAMDPKSKLLVVVDVGYRTLAMAQRVVHQMTQVLAPGCLPLFLTDGFKPLGVPEATPGTGSARRWQPCTPAMAAGLTDHVWSLKEVPLYWVPPWPQPQIV